MAEWFDVVDDEDRAVGRATRDECHKRRLLHRSVQFFIFDAQGRVLVNRRSASKEFFGGLRSIVLGGHVGSGEGYDETAVREAMEEAGVSSKPFRMGYFKKRLPEECENVAVYGFVTEGQPTLLKEEIESGEFLTVEEAEALMLAEKFIPETGDLMRILKDWRKQNGK
jgi:isopentenyldiphosphate isomerase